MNYSKPTIYTALFFLAIIALILIENNYTERQNITSYGFEISLSNPYVFSYLSLIILYILIAFPFFAKCLGKKLPIKNG